MSELPTLWPGFPACPGCGERLAWREDDQHAPLYPPSLLDDDGPGMSCPHCGAELVRNSYETPMPPGWRW